RPSPWLHHITLPCRWPLPSLSPPASTHLVGTEHRPSSQESTHTHRSPSIDHGSRPGPGGRRRRRRREEDGPLLLLGPAPAVGAAAPAGPGPRPVPVWYL
uniref:Uncharacterized protein n=1 Tax=Aegilops tauschii subsp. strangulata TaxID=200361 RepID=A0A452ZWZ4_AEGTS